MKKDISNRDDVELLVDTFYNKIKSNTVIGYIFNDIAKVDWTNHLPRMYSFLASIFFWMNIVFPVIQWKNTFN